jgi:hypothetical protein
MSWDAELITDGGMSTDGYYVWVRRDRFDVLVRRDHNGGHFIWSPLLLDCCWETACRTAAWLREIEGEKCKIEPRPCQDHR